MSTKVKKRNGQLVEFDADKMHNAVKKAYASVGETVPAWMVKEIDNLATKLVESHYDYSVENIQDFLEDILYNDNGKVYKAFVVYRANHALMRESENKHIFDGIINVERNDTTRENANMNASTPAGMMMKFASETARQFARKYYTLPDVLEAMDDNIIYAHDYDYAPTRSLTCTQYPLDKILANGFINGIGEARPAKRIETASALATIAFQTNQNEMHGGQSIPAFDFYMAPYVYMTYQEEVDKLAEMFPNKNYWKTLREEPVKEYIWKDVYKDFESKSRYKQIAINNTIRRTKQAMESFIHNLCTMMSRGGAQTVFSSINYGTDTSAEGRCVIRELLNTTYAGVGNGTTAIFPIQIWKLKKGVSRLPGDPNYDLLQLAYKVSARRFFPNFINLDSTYNKSSEWKKKDPKRYIHEVATMGCRTRVYENRFGPKTSIGRGNLSFTTINLVKLAIETSIEDGYLVKTETGYVFNEEKNTKADKARRYNRFKEKVLAYENLVGKQLDDRFQFQSSALAKQFPFLMRYMWLGGDKLGPEDKVGDIINQGTLGVGFIGLAEALVAITGHHHGEDPYCQEIGLDLLKSMKEGTDNLSEKYQHNYSVIGTPAEGLSGKFTKIDKQTYGEIPGVTSRDYYTNSNHVPVYYKCTPQHKAEIEGPYHKYERGGHIFYVEADADITKNPNVIENIINMACDNDAGYISINHNQGRCNKCNYESNDPNLTIGSTCPHCGAEGSWDILARVTGYLSGTLDRWNSGKTSELKDRVCHTK